MEKSVKAPIFNIVHGSFVDGWGTRTTVFLKGCPLRCVWCCNPEGQKTTPELKFTQEDCTGCGKCVSACPRGAISWDGKLAQVDRTRCNDCLACLDCCPTNALDVFGKYYTVDALFRLVERDQLYFGDSGGVTIGGGEATFFPEFTLAFIRRCQQAYIHTALDTCGYITTPTGLEALAQADLVLYDLKGMDSAAHRRYTGVPNELIHKNLLYRDSLHKDIIIRLPIIPGYTDSESNLQETAEFLAGLKSVRRVDVLPVHKYGALKYKQLGKPYVIGGVRLYTPEEEQRLKAIFESKGLNTQIGG